jgi:hypothetical protein
MQNLVNYKKVFGFESHFQHLFLFAFLVKVHNGCLFLGKCVKQQIISFALIILIFCHLLHYHFYFVGILSKLQWWGRTKVSYLWWLLTINNVLVLDLGILLFIVFHCFTCFAPCCKFCSKVHM